MGTTTIEYEDNGSALGFFPATSQGEDIEAHQIYAKQPLTGGRVRSYNPRNQVSSRLHKTIDENLIVNRIISARKGGY